MRFFHILLLFIAIQSVMAGDGGQAGNGVTYIRRESLIAWFPPGATPTYCIHRTEEFPSKDELSKSFEWAFQTWNDYNLSKKITAPTTNKAFTVHPKKSQKDGSCLGDENITLYFGITDKRTTLLKEPMDVSFAEMDSGNMTSEDSRGVVWFAPSFSITKTLPDWKLEYALEGTLLHEVGHIFGNEHVEGTIMRPDFFRFADADSSYVRTLLKGFLHRIDDSRELYICPTCGFEKNGDTTDPTVFEMITKIKTKEKIFSTLTQAMGDETYSYFLKMQAAPTHADGSSDSYQSFGPYEIRFGTYISRFFSNESIFKIKTAMMFYPKGLQTETSVQRATLLVPKTPTENQEVEVFIRRNNEVSVSICIDHAGKCRVLFSPYSTP